MRDHGNRGNRARGMCGIRAPRNISSSFFFVFLPQPPQRTRARIGYRPRPDRSRTKYTLIVIIILSDRRTRVVQYRFF